MYIHVHEQLVIETRQRKATTAIVSKRAALGRIQTQRTRHMFYQLSYRGSPAGQAEFLNVSTCILIHTYVTSLILAIR